MHKYFRKRASVFSVIACLTLISIFAQILFFIVHSHTSELIDDLINSSLSQHIFHFTVLTPILKFIAIQIAAYCLFIVFIWFISMSCGEFFQLSPYSLGIFFWLTANMVLFALNNHYFPDSFFAYGHAIYNNIVLALSLCILFLGTGFAYYHLLKQRRYVFTGSVFIFFIGIMAAAYSYNAVSSYPHYHPAQNAKPNIILIGIDSLRPDYIHYWGQRAINTPHIDYFLKTAVTFTDAYTPLARTFPSWVSILTAKHPKNSHARINLGYAGQTLTQHTLAKQLQQVGYETVYATDEKRFSNITTEYGFDRILGPGMGVSDFILGGLSDFPLANLLINLPIGRFIFPYNYANRAAAITYDPDNFMRLIKTGLSVRQDKPLFLAIHFCVTHWPFTWARDQQNPHFTLDQRYHSSVEESDKQLGELMQVLKSNGLLEHSLVILLSDHGTALGLPGDRLIDAAHFQGDKAKMKWMTVNKFSRASESSVNFQKDYSLNTTHGQGTDVLSFQQYHIVLAFKGFGMEMAPQQINDRASLLDITPTVLSVIHLPPWQQIDGIALPLNAASVKPSPRSLFLETGYSVSEIETDKIDIEKVIKHTIHLYEINPRNGYLFVRPAAEKTVLSNKQRAILMGDWVLARYPSSSRSKLVFAAGKKTMVTENYVLPAFDVLVNIKTGLWTIGFNSPLAKQAPLQDLRKQFNAFYGEEI